MNSEDQTKNNLSKIITLAVYAVAMALVEAAVVIYLRELYYPTGFLIRTTADVAVIPSGILNVELWREAATIIMLAAVAHLAFGDLQRKVAAFFWTFSIWDLTYYLSLFVFLSWPASLFTLDIYFLIPWPWIGPVLFPVALFSIIAVVSLWFIIKFKSES